MKPQAIVTIVSNNYLHYARTLMQSVARQQPDAERYCIIVDTDLAPSRLLHDEFEAVPLTALGLPFGEEFMFQYTVLELNTAVKPWALQYLLERGHREVLYIDPDICLYQALSEVNTLLQDGASIVLTPHLLAPVTDASEPGELAIRMVGAYNLGFCAVSNQETTRQFLKWWQGKLARDCVNDIPNGVFVDQSWIDLVPGLFAQVAILRHPGYNVAYWNLAQRPLSRSGDSWHVNGQPLVFFHFSGLDPRQPHGLSKYQTRYTLDSVGPQARQLVLEYCERVIGNGLEQYAAMPYGFAHFNDGSEISATTRSYYRVFPEVRETVGPHPFGRPELAVDTRPNSIGTARLRHVYSYFLGRQADFDALQHFRHSCESMLSYLYVTLSVALSAESRGRRGWLGRLLGWPLRMNRLTSQAGDVTASTPVPAAMKVAALMSATPPSAPPAPSPAGPAGAAGPGINLVGYIAAELGIGEGVRGLARACHAAGIAYSVVDVGFQTQNRQSDLQALAHASSQRFAIDLLYVNADQTAQTAAHLQANNLDSIYRIGYWHWEQPQLPPSALPAFSHLHEIWAPSRFVHDAIAAVSPLPVVTIPHAVSVSPSAGLRRSRFGLPDDKLLVLVMYDFHSYQQRKNPQAAIAAFRQAAGQSHDAALVIKTINGAHYPQAMAQLRAEVADLGQVIFIDDYLSRQQAWDLQACCDILLSLHRAEGFGLVPAEMMFLGKPVIATGWSANMDFMTPENSMPVQFTLQPLAADVGAYPAGPLWAEADIDHAASCLRRLLDDRQLRRQLGRQAAYDIGRQLSPASVGRQIAARLQILQHWYPALRGKA